MHREDNNQPLISEKNKGLFQKIINPWSIFIALVAAGLLYFVNTSRQVQDGEQEVQRPATAVEVAPVVSMTLMDTVRGLGTLRPVQEVDLKPEVDGRIKAVHFQEGGFVSKNQLLFEIEEQKHLRRLSSSRAALEEARARQANIQRNHDRFALLFEQSVVSENEFDRVKTDLEAAQAEVRRLVAQVELVKEELADTVIRAPFSGYVSRRLMDPGAFVTTGQILASIYQTEFLEILFMVPEKYSARVKMGQTVIVETAAHEDGVFRGKVSFVSPSVEESTRKLEVKASIDNSDNGLKPGSFAPAVLVLGLLEDTMVIPERALVATRDGYLVFVVDGQQEQVESRKISSGQRRPGLVEVLEGLEPGEKVVVSGHMNLNHGSRIRVVEDLGPDWTGSDLGNDAAFLHYSEHNDHSRSGALRSGQQ
ncbi:efflux RND transporter periplasmic adaptor subunit [Desulfonatronovibrio hydrogenovorans]|uniref:efflux RND transporter periplasmic adaptor subunit n=1 Tax=Desulfonatronovibrio hydrogenovorans TaxID=53245 RepID=UPI001376FE03|nr:efflux RND transporter periplasmic adaptor subunit [Desulfonatronovibrio hydrogenovorans]